MGSVEPDEGEIQKPDYATIGYLPQDGISVTGHSLRKEAETAFAGAVGLKEKLDDAEKKLGRWNLTRRNFMT